MEREREGGEKEREHDVGWVGRWGGSGRRKYDQNTLYVEKLIKYKQKQPTKSN